jgi:hypothetical protein
MFINTRYNRGLNISGSLTSLGHVVEGIGIATVKHSGIGTNHVLTSGIGFIGGSVSIINNIQKVARLSSERSGKSTGGAFSLNTGNSGSRLFKLLDKPFVTVAVLFLRGREAQHGLDLRGEALDLRGEALDLRGLSFSRRGSTRGSARGSTRGSAFGNSTRSSSTETHLSGTCLGRLSDHFLMLTLGGGLLVKSTRDNLHTSLTRNSSYHVFLLLHFLIIIHNRLNSGNGFGVYFF